MRTLLNIIWLLLCGIWLALGYVLAGVICCILIITIPFGLAAFRIANFSLSPFGRELVKRSDAGVASFIGNVIRARCDDHRHSAGGGQSETDPGLARPAGTGDRSC
jgi:hypothetical protein